MPRLVKTKYRKLSPTPHANSKARWWRCDYLGFAATGPGHIVVDYELI